MPTTLSTVRYVIDENLLKLGRSIVDLRTDMVCFGQGPVSDLLPAGVLDPDWIPIVGDRGWVMITNDRRLRTRPREAELAVKHHLKVVHLYSSGNVAAWAQAVRLLSRWDGIERHAETVPEGPWWLSLRGGGLVVQSFMPGAAERA